MSELILGPVSDADRLRWDNRYAHFGPPGPEAVGPALLAVHAAKIPTAGEALDVACGQGGTAVWLAARGLRVLGLDVSPVAIAHAQHLAARAGVADRCRFAVADLDDGPPDGQFDVIVCQRFRDPRLDAALADRLAPGGLLAVSALRHGRFGASAAELRGAFAGLEAIDGGESDGIAWLIGRALGSDTND